MNRVILMGRLTRDAEIRYSQGEQEAAVARFTLAVNRRYKKEDGQQTADFVSCAAFGRTAEFLERYGRKGTKFVLEGRIQTGSYTNRDGQKVYTTDVIAESLEFAESKIQEDPGRMPELPAGDDGFMNIPDGIDEELPFN